MLDKNAFGYYKKWLGQVEQDGLGGFFPKHVYIFGHSLGLADYGVYEIVDKTDDPFDEFLDPDLEAFRGELIGTAKKFTDYFIHHTYPYQNRVVPHLFLLDHDEIGEEKHRKKFEDELQNLNTSASGLWCKYQEFVRQVRAVFAQNEEWQKSSPEHMLRKN